MNLEFSSYLLAVHACALLYTFLSFFTDSAMLGGSYGKLYCGAELKGKTLTTSGNSLRLEFHTDESLSFFGFRAKIKFVPSKGRSSYTVQVQYYQLTTMRKM